MVLFYRINFGNSGDSVGAERPTYFIDILIIKDTIVRQIKKKPQCTLFSRERYKIHLILKRYVNMFKRSQ